MVTAKKIDIRSLDLPQLQQHLTALQQPAFRAKQIYQWLWEKSATTFEEMSNLSKDLRKTLEEGFSINAVQVNNSQFSNDHTIKNTFRLADG
ncbi:MAG: 23S rRNA (adenine(2503)-C(2))-methyltransferase RlmN, partial [Pedobacter sp.]